MIPYSTQSISQEDISAVIEQLRSPMLTQGPAVAGFEKRLADYTGAEHVLAVSNGTAALHLAILALEVDADSLVWTTPNSFVASANCARYVDAEVDFVDIDLDTYCMSIGALKEKLTQAASLGKLPDVVIPVHHSGFVCEMRSIAALADQYNFKIIEDASHALGSSYHSEKVCSSKYSDISVSSFHPVKNITTGEGGAIFTNCEEAAAKIELLRSHGITRDSSVMNYFDETPWHYEQIILGYNYRITDIQCALGSSQLTKLDAWTEQRNELAARYDKLFSGAGIKTQTVTDDIWSARHLYVVRIPDGNRDLVGKALRSKDILVNLHYAPIHLQPYYRKLGFKLGDFPQAETYGRDALSIPLFPALTYDEQDMIVHEILSLSGI